MTEPGSARSSADTKELWKVTAAFAFFAVLTLVAASLIERGATEFLGVGGGLLFVAAGFTVASGSVLPWMFSEGRRAGSRPGRLALVGVGVGVALWLAAPMLILAGGAQWTDPVGSGRRGYPLWFFALIVSAPACAAVIASCVAVLRKVRTRREASGDDSGGPAEAEPPLTD